MTITNSTNKTSHPSYRWFLGKTPQKNPRKVNSLIYKDYTLVEYKDGTKSYVSPEEKAQLDVDGKLRSSKLSLKNEKEKVAPKEPASDSDSEYEIPVVREKPKSLDDLNQISKPEVQRTSSFPFSGGELSPGDNGKINLPPYLVPLETSLTFPMTKQKRKEEKNKKKKDLNAGNSSPDEADAKKRFSLKDWGRNKKKLSEDSAEEPKLIPMPWEKEKSNVESEGSTKRVSWGDWETKNEEDDTQEVAELEVPIEIFPEKEESEITKRYSRDFLPKFQNEFLKKERRLKMKKVDPNPLKKMFGIKVKPKKSDGDLEDPETEVDLAGERMEARYSDADLSQIQSDTESADHGSADKSSMSKLTSEKQPKKLMSGLFGSFKMGRNKDKVADNDAAKNPSSFEITVKEQPEDHGHNEVIRSEGIVYAELDMARSPGNVMRRDDEKTEYAEIIYPGTKLTVERQTEELRKSRENLTSSRENLTEVDEAYLGTQDGKKEAAV